MKRKLIPALVVVLALTAVPLFCATLSVNWAGSRGLMPQVSEGSSYAASGGKIYVFGGFTYDMETGGVWIYDAATGQWSAGASMPTARFYSSASEAGGKIYVIGGGRLQSGGAVNSLSTVEVYDPATNGWSSGPSLPVALRGHSSVSANGKVYVMGGRTASGYSSDVYELDPSGGSWSSLSVAPFAAAYGGAFYSQGESKVYFVGGLTGDPSSAANYMGKAYSMNLPGGGWDAGTYAMPFKTSNFATAYDGASGKAYLVGGMLFLSEETSYFDIQVFDTSTHGFESSTLALMPSPLSRYNNAAAVISGKLYMAAGAGVLAADEYTIAADSWYEPNAKLPADISGAASGVFSDKLYVVGGGFWSPLEGAVHQYTPASNSWVERSGQDPQARIYAAFGSYNGKLYVSGGMNSSGAVLSGAVVYDPTADSFTALGGTDPAPAIFSASAVHGGKLYVFGGRTNPSNQNSLSNKTRILDLGSGSFSPGPDMPLAFEQASAVTVGDRIYIFGGATTTAPDYMNKNILVFDPAASTFTVGAIIPFPVYASSAASYGNFALFDSGYHLFYSSQLAGLAGGPFSFLQVYDTSSGTFAAVQRPGGRLSHSTGVIGTRLYAAGGDDGFWPSSRLDIADLVSTGCSLSCTAEASPASGAAPLTVAFTSTATGTNCSGSASYSWNFGDGGTSTLQNPSHEYTAEGTFNWSLTVSWNGQTCLRSGTVTVGGCQVACEAQVTPASGTAPLAVSFSASSTATGCSSAVSYLWDFGDSSTSDQQSASHTYSSAGTFAYSLTATADQTDCVKTGTITVTEPGTCSVTCTASATPSSGQAPLSVAFTSTATPVNCTGTPSYLWNFGDGGTSDQQNPSHSYVSAGTYSWSLTVTTDGRSCSQAGSVTVSEAPDGPSVNGVSKVGNPFRLKVIGAKFVEGSRVFINGVQVPSTKYKSISYLVAKKGSALKAMAPKGVTVYVKVVNPDNSESNEFPYTR